jgi:TonB family protein
MRMLTRLLCVLALLVSVMSAESLDETRKKAESGFTLAQWLLGGAYAKGNGVPKDSAEAVKWYRKAAEQGFAMAQSDLGLMYEHGEGVTKDSAEAVKWYRKAAATGDAGGRFNLGLSYAKGEGVPEDLIQAHFWLNLAGATEDETYTTFAKISLARIEAKMNAEQKAKAMKLAREMFERETTERLAVAKARAEKDAADKAAVAERVAADKAAAAARVAATEVEAEKRRPDRYPVATYQSRAVYPYESRAAGRAGEVSVSYTIDVRGKVINARAVRSSSKEFEAAAVAAVEKWKFRPAMKNGKAIEIDMEVPIVFTLSEEN